MPSSVSCVDSFLESKATEFLVVENGLGQGLQSEETGSNRPRFKVPLAQETKVLETWDWPRATFWRGWKAKLE